MPAAQLMKSELLVGCFLPFWRSHQPHQSGRHANRADKGPDCSLQGPPGAATRQHGRRARPSSESLRFRF